MSTYSSILAWEIPWTEEPSGLQSMGSQRVGHDLSIKQQCWNELRPVGLDMEWMYFACKKIWILGAQGIEYHRLSFMSPMQFMHWSHNPHYDDIWRWSLWNMSRDLLWRGRKKKRDQCFLSFSALWGHSKNVAICITFPALLVLSWYTVNRLY